jgi:hypothetical protein
MSYWFRISMPNLFEMLWKLMMSVWRDKNFDYLIFEWPFKEIPREKKLPNTDCLVNRQFSSIIFCKIYHF